MQLFLFYFLKIGTCTRNRLIYAQIKKKKIICKQVRELFMNILVEFVAFMFYTLPRNLNRFNSEMEVKKRQNW